LQSLTIKSIADEISNVWMYLQAGYGIGANSMPVGGWVGNHLNDVKIDGNTDGVFFSVSGSVLVHTLTITNCEIYTAWDSIIFNMGVGSICSISDTIVSADATPIINETPKSHHGGYWAGGPRGESITTIRCDITICADIALYQPASLGLSIGYAYETRVTLTGTGGYSVGNNSTVAACSYDRNKTTGEVIDATATALVGQDVILPFDLVLATNMSCNKINMNSGITLDGAGYFLVLSGETISGGGTIKNCNSSSKIYAYDCVDGGGNSSNIIFKHSVLDFIDELSYKEFPLDTPTLFVNGVEYLPNFRQSSSTVIYNMQDYKIKGPLTIEFDTPYSDAVVHYVFDGDDPDRRSTKYDKDNPPILYYNTNGGNVIQIKAQTFYGNENNNTVAGIYSKIETWRIKLI
jgi:hypothetical protein